jgi:hypothetical protein
MYIIFQAHYRAQKFYFRLVPNDYALQRAIVV